MELTEGQLHTIRDAAAALECFALYVKTRRAPYPYAEHADAQFDAEHQRDRLKVAFPEAFAK